MKPLHILLREFRKTVIQGKVVNTNIGTTAHAPGLLSLLAKYVPDCEVRVWASAPLSPPMAKMMERSFPHISLVTGDLTEPTRELKEAVDWSDILLIGSGSGILEYDVEAYRNFSGKPFGAAGIGYDKETLALMQKSDFLFFRESAALAEAGKQELAVPMGYLPDGAFLFDAPDEESAGRFMAQYDLTPYKFAACVVRYRWTPVWEYAPGAKFDPRRQAYNQSMLEKDFAPLVLAVTRIVREKHLKVLLAPETLPALALIRDTFFHMFPEDVKPFLAVPDHFWEADEALGVYRKCLGIFGLEMHSQVMGIGNGIPSIVCRTREFGSKSRMWQDLHLDKWLFDFDSERDKERFPDTVMEMLSEPDKSHKLVAEANMILERYFDSFRDFMKKYISTFHL